MNLKTYQAYTMAEALAAVKRDLGPGAVILNTRSFKRGALLGIGGRTVFEVTATVGDQSEVNPLRRSTASARPATRAGAARQAYQRSGNSPRPRAPSNPSLTTALADDEPFDPEQMIERLLSVHNQPPVESDSAAAGAPASVSASGAPAPSTVQPGSMRTISMSASTTTPAGAPDSSSSAAAPAASHLLKAISGSSQRSDTAAAGSGPPRRFVLSPTSDHERADDDSLPMPEAPATNGREPPTTTAGSTAVGQETHAEGNNFQRVNSTDIHTSPAAGQEIEPKPARSKAEEMTLRAGGRAMEDELAAIRSMVSLVLQRQSTAGATPTMPQPLFDAYLCLLGQDVKEEIADEVVNAVRDDLTTAQLEDTAQVRRAMIEHLAQRIPVARPPIAASSPDGRPLTIALIGPTGVGKTTTLAKLAASFKLRHGRKVGMITADTYRIAAVDQLRTYANIIGLPLQVTLSPAEMRQAVHQLSDCEVILIDTAGRSQNDAERLSELRTFIQAAGPHEIHLVLSSTAGEKMLMREAEAFGAVGMDKIVLTKLDEAASLGAVVNALHAIERPLSFCTTGQEVPDHIEVADAMRFATRIMGDEAKR